MLAYSRARCSRRCQAASSEPTHGCVGDRSYRSKAAGSSADFHVVGHERALDRFPESPVPLAVSARSGLARAARSSPIDLCEGQDLFDIPEMVTRVVAVVPGDVLGPLLTSCRVVEHNMFLDCCHEDGHPSVRRKAG